MPSYTAKTVVAHAPDFAARLEARMAERSIGVRELAKRAKIDKGTVLAWRKGTTATVTVELVRRVADTLDTTVEHLLDLPPATAPVRAAAPEPAAAPRDQLLSQLSALHPHLETILPPLIDLASKASRR